MLILLIEEILFEYILERTLEKSLELSGSFDTMMMYYYIIFCFDVRTTRTYDSPVLLRSLSPPLFSSVLSIFLRSKLHMR